MCQRCFTPQKNGVLMSAQGHELATLVDAEANINSVIVSLPAGK
jgi:hypothetical protein